MPQNKDGKRDIEKKIGEKRMYILMMIYQIIPQFILHNAYNLLLCELLFLNTITFSQQWIFITLFFCLKESIYYVYCLIKKKEYSNFLERKSKN